LSFLDASADGASSEQESTGKNPFEGMTGEQLIEYAVQHFNDGDEQEASELDISARSSAAQGRSLM
jgi:hypothetical protein